MQLNRENINFFLNDLDTPITRVINRIIIGLIIIWSGILVAATYQIPDNINLIIDVINITILLIFVVEYHFRFYLWIVNSTIKDENTYYLILDLIAILPYSLAAINPILIYWLGWLRILKLLRFIHKQFLFIRIPDEALIFSRLVYTFFAIIFIFSGVIYQVEHPNNELFSSFIDTVYFSIVTITTVGFGDVTPNSELGRFLTILMILFGSVLILPQVGDSIKQLIQSANKVSDSCDPNSDVQNQDS
ncbi:ion transport protein [Calothrix parasitica NIES-267]|uniref:Ion transport protein n=1 Tax=Calothrix parasitica NIES-267 TaxID=1973488 RepID=A0A1Z4LQ01_9CYAN|nr:ion transport protein [Calothrix parasitica NIES-267]